MFTPNVNGQTAQTLFDLVGPGTAGQYIGQQRIAEQAMNPINQNLSLAELAKAQEFNRHTATMNPMLEDVQASAQRKANLQDPTYWTEMLKGDTADSGRKQLDLRKGLATEKTEVAATNQSNRLKAVQDFGKEITTVASYLGGIDPSEIDQATGKPARFAALEEIASQSPNLVQNPVFQQLMKLPPEKLPQGLEVIANRLINSNPELLNTKQIHAASDASRERASAGNNEATIEAARLRAAADKQMASETPDKKVASLLQAIAIAESSGQPNVVLGKDRTGQIISLPIPAAKKLANDLYSGQAGLREISRPQNQVEGIPQSSPAKTAADEFYRRLNGGLPPQNSAPKKWNSQKGIWE